MSRRIRVAGAALALSLVLNSLLLLFGVLTLGSGPLRLAIYDALCLRIGRPDIVFIGDSLTAGGGMWGLKVGRSFNAWNYGRPGYETWQMRYVADEAVRQGAELAFVMAGTNDRDRSMLGVDKSFADYRDMLDALRAGGVEPVIQFTVFKGAEENPAFVVELNRRLLAYAAQHRLRTIDLNPVLAPNAALLPKYRIDNTHFSPLAYDVWRGEIERLLVARGAGTLPR